MEFVDPGSGTGSSEPPAVDAEAPVSSGSETSLPLEHIAFDPHGSTSEIASLRRHYERIRVTVEDDEWRRSKQDLLAMTSEPEFWRTDDRFRVLGKAEYMDRIERGLQSAGSLLERLLGTRPGSRDHYPRELVGRLAEQLYLLDAACAGLRGEQPREAFLLLEAGKETGAIANDTNVFAARLGAMYQAWARKRRMQLQIIEESVRGAGEPYRLLAAVSGYAAYPLLQPEEGLHVLEFPDGDGNGFSRCKVRVRVAPQPDEPAEDSRALRQQALAAVRHATPAKLVVVRRYRERPAPLVRDRVRGWRSGKLDRVLGGDFDLILPDDRR